MINIGNILPLATITIYKNGTRVVDNRHGSLLQALESGEDEGKALIINRLYANGTLVSEIYNGPTFVIFSNGTRLIQFNGDEFVQKAGKKVPWFAPVFANFIYNFVSNFALNHFKIQM